ncbi:MAG: DNA helicase PcrA [Clostridia bacterium]|nr:DNA helicase PcrA [Clostridia bacterium]
MNLNELNPMQRKAAERLEGPVLILAGAGSGKTRTLTYRVANLLEHGVPAWRILALTFTNKAAREMRERIERLAGADAGDAWIGTFHSVCCRILRRDIEKIGYERNFTIYDEDDQQRVIKGLLKEMDIDEKALPPRSVSAAISDAKNRLMSPDEWLKSAGGDYRNQKVHDVMLGYEKRLRAANALDFDDLLMKALQLFLDHPPVLEYYQQRFQYVHVDEYQDTNYAQYQFVRLLTRESRNLCVVGDDDQSIYGWRGADTRNILDFEKDYPDAYVIKLEQNYRSTANILDAANQIIAHNAGRKEKELWTEDGEGEKISLYSAGDEREEAAWIAGRIGQMRRQGMQYGQMAILYRMHALSRVLEETLMRAGIPYRVYGGTRFYDRREIRDILAYLRLIENPADDISLGRIINVPKRAIGDSTVDALQQFARRNDMSLYAAVAAPPDTLGSRARKSVESFAAMMAQLLIMKEMLPLSQFVQKVIDDAGLIAQYEKDLNNNEENQTRIENIREFMSAVTEFEQKSEDKTLFAFLENVALVTELDNQENTPNFVTMMTLHSAKGLEYDAVFMSGMEEGIFPSARSLQEENRLEEERRLCYVGVTRARKQLSMSFARRRMLFNQTQFNAPSCFIREIPKRLVREEWGGSAPQAAGGWGSYGGTGMRAQPRPQYGFGDTVPQRSTGKAAVRNPLEIPGVQRGFVASQARNINIQLFKAGDHVMHRKFGKGTVRQVTGSGDNARISIVFPVFGEKVFALSIAPIIKVEE